MQRIIELLIAVVFGILIGGIIFWIASPPRGKSIELLQNPTSNEIVIYITGEVNTPGVYTLPANSRVIDAIIMAGGLTSDGDNIYINQAAPLQDGAKILIPKLGDEPDDSIFSGEVTASGESHPLDLSITTPIDIININSATLEELDTLPGIGPEKAQAILDYRTEKGSFKSIEEIQFVTGIGSKLFSGFKDWITVE